MAEKKKAPMTTVESIAQELAAEWDQRGKHRATADTSGTGEAMHMYAVRLSAGEKQRMQARAKALGLSTSELARKLMIEGLDRLEGNEETQTGMNLLAIVDRQLDATRALREALIAAAKTAPAPAPPRSTKRRAPGG